jgi:hypothetical protein
MIMYALAVEEDSKLIVGPLAALNLLDPDGCGLVGIR